MIVRVAVVSALLGAVALGAQAVAGAAEFQVPMVDSRTNGCFSPTRVVATDGPQPGTAILSWAAQPCPATVSVHWTSLATGASGDTVVGTTFAPSIIAPGAGPVIATVTSLEGPTMMPGFGVFTVA